MKIGADEQSILDVYTQELISLSEKAAAPRRITNPEVSAKAISPICGSIVTVELVLRGDKVADFGYEVEACALTRTVIAVMRTAILGKTREEAASAGRSLRAMLEAGGPPPEGDWEMLRILAPVAEYTSRHNAILLPFEAVEKAFKKRELA